MNSKWKTKQPARSPFVTQLLDTLTEIGPVTARAMFGGHGIYLDGVMIGLVADGVLYLKVDDQTQPQFEAADCQPFQYRRPGREKPITMSYWETPVDALENPNKLAVWARLGHEAALRSKRVKRKRK